MTASVQPPFFLCHFMGTECRKQGNCCGFASKGLRNGNEFDRIIKMPCGILRGGFSEIRAASRFEKREIGCHEWILSGFNHHRPFCFELYGNPYKVE